MGSDMEIFDDKKYIFRNVFSLCKKGKLKWYMYVQRSNSHFVVGRKSSIFIEIYGDWELVMIRIHHKLQTDKYGPGVGELVYDVNATDYRKIGL